MALRYLLDERCCALARSSPKSRAPAFATHIGANPARISRALTKSNLGTLLWLTPHRLGDHEDHDRTHQASAAEEVKDGVSNRAEDQRWCC